MKNTFRASLALSLSLLGCSHSHPASTTPAPLAAETPAQHDARMAWWRDARFGMFIHFGLYSSAGGNWKGQTTPSAGEWLQDHFKIPADEYERALLPAFNPTQFDAKKIVQVAKDAGMKYIVITSKHHEGFCLFDSRYTDFDVRVAPFHRDIMKEMAAAAHAAGIQICWYHSIMDWHQPLAKGETFPLYRDGILRPELRELLTNYGHIGVLWFDGEWIKEWTEDQGKALYAELRKIQPDLIINNRISKARAGMQGINKYQGAGDYSTPEQQVPKTAPAGDWETCMTMNDTWGYKFSDHNWKSTPTLIHTLVDVASKGGNLLLNVGPTGQGLIPDASLDRLAAIGAWMKINGDSIHGTTRSPFPDQPSYGRITAHDKTLYLHLFNYPADGKITLPPTSAHLLTAHLLASPSIVLTFPTPTTLQLPGTAPDPIDTVLALTYDTTPTP
ncbi:MAG TPA: alpha-L-fucosidase [Tepidisphaeraceae bacterium]|jgi:alpha-L-fucosidase|nr:alpha-L-fucosidase [Tepidisphaeraceae bacterium]